MKNPLRISKLLYLIVIVLYSCGGEQSTQRAPEAPQTNDSSVQKGMILVPSGEYMMGGKSDQADKDELPRRSVKISAFWMDATEVTNREFKTFVDETGYVTVAEKDIDWDEMAKELPPGTPKPADSVLKAGSLVFNETEGPVNLRDYSQWWTWTIGANWRHPEGPGSGIEDKMDHPVVHIAYIDALSYAKWANKRLPTEAEWEWAAQGGLEDVKYPWGNEDVEQSYDKANFWQGNFPYQNLEKDGYYGTAPVKSFAPNGYGLYDMAGNVWEWCLDKYRVDTYAKTGQSLTDPQGPEESFDPTEPYTEKYVLRGGSFLCNDSYCSGYRVARRMRSSKDSGLNHTGFRCVRDL